MIVERQETAVEILEVRDENNWKFSIDADIPEFGEKTFKFLTWRKGQGDPPVVGQRGIADMEPWRRSPFYIKRGEVAEGEIDGTEERPWFADWQMLGFKAQAFASAGQPNNGAGIPTQPPASVPHTATSAPTPPSAVVFLDALTRYRIDNELKNARDAIWMALKVTEGEAGHYDIGDLLENAEPIRLHLNDLLRQRLGGGDEWLEELECTLPPPPLVEAAQEAGATLVSVEPETIEDLLGFDGEPPLEVDGHPIRNRADVVAFVTEKGWAKAAIEEALQANGYADSAGYLKNENNTPQTLAQLLNSALGGG